MTKTQTKPLVVVTGPAKRFKFGWWGARLMLWLSGARSCYVTARNPRIPDSAAGVILGGGDDIDPQHYGFMGDADDGEPLGEYDPARDQLEMQVARQALACNVPILGICRGAQLLNVVLGGTLLLDIRPLRQQTPNRNTLFPIKWADVDGASKLVQILGTNSIKINSLHSQAIDKVADLFQVVARDRDGFVQAVEAKSGTFTLGVQWHPEYMPFHSSQRKLFKAFVSEVRDCQHTLHCQSADKSADKTAANQVQSQVNSR